jgi:hypothetical protein
MWRRCRSNRDFYGARARVDTVSMKHLVSCIAALSIGCASSPPPEARRAARAPAAPVVPVATTATTAAVETAAEFGLTTYVEPSTRTSGVVCLQLDGREDPRPSGYRDGR